MTDLVGSNIAEKITKAATKNPKTLTTTKIDETLLLPTEIPEERSMSQEK